MSSLVFITNTAGTAGRAPWPRSSSRLCVPAVLGRPEHPVPDRISWRGEGAQGGCSLCHSEPFLVVTAFLTLLQRSAHYRRSTPRVVFAFSPAHAL